MNVALTGASGFIGSRIAVHLHKAGHTVTGLVRETSRREHLSGVVDRFVVGDHADESCWDELWEGADCVIHNSFDWQVLRAGDTEAHWRSNLLASIKFLVASSPRQFIFNSSIAVHHDIRPKWHGVIDEDHPLRPASLYGAFKAAVEAHLWAEHFEHQRHTSAVRPCAVYGLDPQIDRSIGYPIVQSIRAGQPYSRAGGGKFVHVDDVAAAVTAIVGNASASGRTFNLVDCYARWADWAAIIASELGITVAIDESSPPRPKNEFSKDAAQSLGVQFNRGHEGIRQYVRELIAQM
jgi:dTDP-glucose 4,6-dehydratase